MKSNKLKKKQKVKLKKKWMNQKILKITEKKLDMKMELGNFFNSSVSNKRRRIANDTDSSGSYYKYSYNGCDNCFFK